MTNFGTGWREAMRGAKKRDGETCGRCKERPSHQVVMVGIPSPMGMSFEGDVALCDECLEKIMQGEDNALALVDRLNGGAK